MNALLTAVDAATVALLLAMLATLALTPARRHALFAHLARLFVAGMAIIVLISVGGETLAREGLTEALIPVGESLQMLWVPLVLLVAYSMLDGDQLDRQRITMKSFERATGLVGAVAEAAPAGLLLLDMTGRIMFANRAALDLLDLEEDEDLCSIADPVWRLRAPTLPGEGTAALVSRSPMRDVSVTVEWPGNRRRHLAVNTLPMERADGIVSGVLVTFTDRAPWLEAAERLSARR